MTDNTYGLPPIVSVSGDQAALAFIKSDGTTRRLYVFRRAGSNASWQSLGPADAGASGEHVHWADISINASGQIAVAFEAEINAGAAERIYGNVYSGGNWQGVTRLDNFSSSGVALSTTPPPATHRPSVSIDSSGNAVATFSMYDNTVRRRAVSSVYR